MVKQLFLEHLTRFELTLHSFGYTKNIEESIQSQIYKENLTVEYNNDRTKQSIRLNYLTWDNGKIVLTMTMYKIPDKGTFFSLDDFLNNRGLSNRIVSELPVGSDVEPFVAKYFQDLDSLFKNELNDQITGKTFENHMDSLNESWNKHRDSAYEMEKKEVADFIKRKKD